MRRRKNRFAPIVFYRKSRRTQRGYKSFYNGKGIYIHYKIKDFPYISNIQSKIVRLTSRVSMVGPLKPKAGEEVYMERSEQVIAAPLQDGSPADYLTDLQSSVAEFAEISNRIPEPAIYKQASRVFSDATVMLATEVNSLDFKFA